MEVKMTSFKITATESLFARLLNDKELFQLNMSQNDFLTQVVIKTYDYQDSLSELKDVCDILSGKTNKLADNPIIEAIKNLNDGKTSFKRSLNDIGIEILKLRDNIPSEVGKKDIFLREKSKTEGALTQIVNETDSRSAADTFRSLLYKYMAYPSYIRERILFMDIYDTLSTCIKKKYKCKIVTTNNKTFLVDPYKLIPGLDEFHYYITGFAKNVDQNYDRQIMAFKLSMVKAVYKMKDTLELSIDEVKEIVDKVKASGPAFLSGEYKEYKVEFDPFGQKLFNSLYVDRPKCIHMVTSDTFINEYGPQTKKIYTFYSSEFQIYNYLKDFGYHAMVLDDEILREKLLKYFERAYNQYSIKAI